MRYFFPYHFQFPSSMFYSFQYIVFSPQKEMATHSSILAWRIPRTKELGGLQSMGHKESDTTERLLFHFRLSLFLESSLDACINRIFFLLPLADISLLVHRNAKSLSKLILYRGTLMNSFICSHNFWLLHGFQMATFLLCSHMLFSQCVCVCVCVHVHVHALEL